MSSSSVKDLFEMVWSTQSRIASANEEREREEEKLEREPESCLSSLFEDESPLTGDSDAGVAVPVALGIRREYAVERSERASCSLAFGAGQESISLQATFE